MRKSIILVAMAVIASSTFASAQCRYEANEARQQAQTLTAEGWISDTNNTIEYEMIEYNRVLNSGNYLGYVSLSPAALNNPATAKNLAMREAMKQVVMSAEHEFQGMGHDITGIIDDDEISAYLMTCVDRFKARIGDGFHVQFSIYRKQGNKYEYQVFCYMDKNGLETMCYDIFQEILVEYEDPSVVAQFKQIRNSR